MSALTLLTSSWRVEHPHAVATLVVRDPVSLSIWVLLTVITVGCLSVVLAAAMLGSIAAMVVAALPLLATAVAAAGLQQRVAAWRTAGGRRGALAVANVASDPKGCGHGAALMAAIVDFADGIGRELVLRVDPTNEPAVRLYRACGFVQDGNASGRRVRMVRAPLASRRRTELSLPSWLVPIRCSAATAAVAAVVAVVLVAAYWGTPAVWSIAPAVLLGAVAAENDLRTLRIPNRLVAAGAAAVGLATAFAAMAFDAAIVVPAVIGAAIFAVPLFVNHVLAPGRSGLGDVKLAAVLGLVAGTVHPSAAMGALLVSMVLGGVFGVVWRRRHRGGFPLAPALAAGTTLVLALWAVLEGPTTW